MSDAPTENVRVDREASNTTIRIPGTGRTRYRRDGSRCGHCGRPAHQHDRERVYPDDGPTGSYHYRLYCPGGGGS